MNKIKKFIRKLFRFASFELSNKIDGLSNYLNDLSNKTNNTTSHLNDLSNKTNNIAVQLNLVEESISNIINSPNQIYVKIEEIKKLLTSVEHYQPLYNLNIVNSPARTCKDRCERIFDSFDNDVGGMQILDLGSSLGYISLYFSDRGAKVEGWDTVTNNVQISRLVSEITGVKADFKIKELSIETVETILDNHFDVVIALSVFHHIIHFQGLENAQKIVRRILEKVPVLIVELAKKGEDNGLYWDETQPENELDLFNNLEVEITKIGDFNNHLSDKTRPLYIIKGKQTIKVNNTVYNYRTKQNFAYKHSTIRASTLRRYYFSAEYIIKEYLQNDPAVKNFDESFLQMTNEVLLLKALPEIVNSNSKAISPQRMLKIINPPEIIDFEISHQRAVLVLKRKPGILLWDMIQTAQLNDAIVNQIFTSIYDQIKALHSVSIFHNDVRVWNILVDLENNEFSLIDYGLASTIKYQDDFHALLWAIYYTINGKQQPPNLDAIFPEFNDAQLTSFPIIKQLLAQSSKSNLAETV